jgi:hypothetical protein
MKWDDPLWRTRYLTRVWWPEVVCVAGFLVALLGGVFVINRTLTATWGLWQWLLYLLVVGLLGYYGVAIVDALADRWVSVIMANRWRSWWQWLARWYDLADVAVTHNEGQGPYTITISLVQRALYAPSDRTVVQFLNNLGDDKRPEG